MDTYPTSRTWPVTVLVVIILAMLAARNPEWWSIGGRIPKDPVKPHASLREFAKRNLPLDPRIWHRSEQRILPPLEVVSLEVMPLDPPVADRITVPPAPEYQSEVDRQSADLELSGWKSDAAGSPTSASPNVPTLNPVLDRPHLRDQLPVVTAEPAVDRHRQTLEVTLPDVADLSATLPDLTSAPPADSPRLAAWPVPVSLLSLLDQVDAEVSQIAKWSADIRAQLATLSAYERLDRQACLATLQQLEQLAQQATRLEVYVSESQRVLLRRIQYALTRRIDVWREAHQLAVEQSGLPLVPNVMESMGILEDVETHVRQHPFQTAWRNYLMLEELERVVSETWISDPVLRREIARTVLRRINADDLSDEQHSFLDHQAVRDLTNQLSSWADHTVDITRLLNSIEQYEETRSASVAKPIIDEINSLAFCHNGCGEGLRTALNKHYRNANIRFTVTGNLLNDLVPKIKPMHEQIVDNVLGANVRGRNQSWTDLRVRLVEDGDQLRFQVLAEGTTSSQTLSTKGPIRFQSRSRSKFVANKELVVSSDGIFTHEAQGRANGNTRITRLVSDYDQIPILGWVVRQMAINEIQENHGQIRNVLRRRVRDSAVHRLDKSIHQQLTKAEDRLADAVLRPLNKLNLDPQAIDLKTSGDRMAMRFRIAAENQLAAYTPRPRAPDNNVLSVQLHESTANNLLDRLELEDQRVQLDELVPKLTQQLGLKPTALKDEIPENVLLHLGNERPIQFEFNQGRVIVTIRIQLLQTPRRRWRNIAVRASYRANIGETDVNLQRDGGIQMVSDNLGFRDQIALRGIFTKVMSRNHQLNILQGRIKENAKLNDLSITEFVVRDGWIGLSVGPRQHTVAAR